MRQIDGGSVGDSAERPLYVWSLFIRFFHLAIIAAFCVDYITQGKPFWLHKYAGLTIFSLVLVRIVAGFWGSPYARFRDFIYPPRVVWGYLKGLITGQKVKRYIGHSPAGGAMVIALIVCLLSTSGSGLSMYLLHRLAPTRPQVHQQSGGPSADHKPPPSQVKKKKPRSMLKRFHFFMAQFTLVLILLHIAGVALASYVHRENLTKAMITGWKRRF